MPWKSPEPVKLHEMARHFREFAGETRYPDYIRMMIRTADDLDSLAAKMENDPDPMARVEVLESN